MIQWFWFGIIASALWSITVIIDKIILNKWIKNPYSYQVFLFIPIILFAFSIFSVTGNIVIREVD